MGVWKQHAGPMLVPQLECQAGEAKDVGSQLRQGSRSMAAVLPLASTSLAGSSMSEVYYGLGKALDLYLLVLTVRVLLSWFRNINWYGEPWNTLRQLTDPFLNLFRGVIPPIGGIDLSPMLGFMLLNIARNFLLGMA